jgi:hypothetical protein
MQKSCRCDFEAFKLHLQHKRATKKSFRQSIVAHEHELTLAVPQVSAGQTHNDMQQVLSCGLGTTKIQEKNMEAYTKETPKAA